MILEIDGWKFQVFDVANRKYYAREAAEHCTCATCRNFYRTVDTAYPELRPFLARFGVHIEAPDKMTAVIPTLCDCYYTVCGSILERGVSNIVSGKAVICPQTQENVLVNTDMQEPYFFLLVSGLMLPWVLDEPMEELDTPEKKQNAIARILSRWINEA